MDKVDLLKLIEDDNLGLLKIHPKKSSMLTADERLVESFHEINKFISVYGREPEPGKDFYEHKLHARLKGIRENDEKISALTDLDEYGLLQKKIKRLNQYKIFLRMMSWVFLPVKMRVYLMLNMFLKKPLCQIMLLVENYAMILKNMKINSFNVNQKYLMENANYILLIKSNK